MLEYCDRDVINDVNVNSCFIQGCQRTLKTLKTLKSLEIEKATLKTLKKVLICPQTLKTVIRTLKKCFPCLPQFDDYVSTCNRELGHLVSDRIHAL